MNFHVDTPNGIIPVSDFPDDLPVGILLRELVTDESRQLRPPKPEAWHLLHENSEHKLDLSKSLTQNGVHHGERLRLQLTSQPSQDVSPQHPPEGMKRCDNGHYYDPKKHAAGCPYCGAAIPMPGKRTGTMPQLGDEPTRPQGFQVAGPGATDDAPTRVYSFGGTTAIDPVVGWFVCTHGDRGRDYRIRSENNTIGRSRDMYISISGDDSISRERHAVVSFDPQKNEFHLSPGEGRGLVYVNGEVLLSHRKLQAYDRIQLGKTKLVFVPFCGEKFSWAKEEDS
jgi:FHA domain/WXG100 protein secretion system (Wss), protein YukD